MTTVLGIDIGGTGIKGAPVDIRSGQLLADRHRILTPHPATPDAVTAVVADLAKFFDWTGPAGAAFPAVIKNGVARTAANVDRQWIGTDAAKLFSQVIGGDVTVVNDADAAGIAEMTFGAGKDRTGVVIMITLGTGIGSALFVDGKLVPNTELGHLKMGKKDAEKRAAESVREEQGLTWKAWSSRLDAYLVMMEALFWPDLIIVGGGISKKSDKFLPRLSLECEIVPAQLLNEAGIVGAALAHALRAPVSHTD
ncbi:MAG: polyphosphate glucokinase [Actinomycetota bacterium]|nr:polyphosphate glucokinase [Actinomycetota bacterium]